MLAKRGTLAVIMEGGLPVVSIEAGPAQAMWKDMRATRNATTLDTLERLLLTDRCDVLLCTNVESLQAEAREMGADVWPTTDSFVFLQEIQAIVEQRRPEQIVILGGCAIPLVGTEELSAWFDAMSNEEEPRTVWAHGFLSPDIVGWKPAREILNVRLCANDNALGAALRDQAGMDVRWWERFASWQCDIDTPVDALLVQHHPMAGGRLRKLSLFEGHRVPLDRLRAVMEAIDRPDIALIGRVNPGMIQYINETRKVRLRAYSEERGMKGLGRDVRGEAVSLFDHFVQLAGWDGMFAALQATCKGVFMDTRVLMACRMAGISETDRFLSDLGWYESIAHPDAKAMTEAAQRVDIPVALGGHTLVSGGLRAFLDC